MHRVQLVAVVAVVVVVVAVAVVAVADVTDVAESQSEVGLHGLASVWVVGFVISEPLELHCGSERLERRRVCRRAPGIWRGVLHTYIHTPCTPTYTHPTHLHTHTLHTYIHTIYTPG